MCAGETGNPVHVSRMTDNNKEPDFERIASRALNRLGETGFPMPEIDNGDENTHRHWAGVLASILRVEMGYDEAGD